MPLPLLKKEYYRSFVFGRRRRLVTKGGFIEDKLGQVRGLWVARKSGLDATEQYQRCMNHG